ncbi:MAG TPA: hypothetical protein EYN74_09890 [Nitrospirales bacterium]|nr:hypothetical protein [Nitrospirales bacterium]HIB53837.1 hypothetical protein [Nitrospirales bacterium]
MPQQSSKNTGTLQGVSVTLFALTSITPLLVLVMIIDRFDLLQQSGITMLVTCTAIVSLLGFFSFLQTIKQISALADGISQMQAGQMDAIKRPVHHRELAEVAKIRKALASMMTELHATPRELSEKGSRVRDE